MLMPRLSRAIISIIFTLSLLPQLLHARPAPGLRGKAPTVLATAAEAISAATASSAARVAAGVSSSLIRTDSDGRILVALACADVNVVSNLVERAGGTVIETASDLHLLEAWVPAAALSALAESDAVVRIRPVTRPVTRAGSYQTEGDAVMGADVLRSHGADGTGVKVGVISDDVDHLSDAQAAGELPSVTVIRRTPDSGDEGTAMLEIVHDIAPGADLYFATGVVSKLGMKGSIEDLADAGCDVIVDDIGWFDEPVFEDGVLADAVDAAVSDGVTFVSAAGNSGQNTWVGAYVSGGGPDGTTHLWDGSADTLLAVTVPAHRELIAILQWDDPLGASDNDYDLYLYDQEGRELSSSIGPQDGNDDPWEGFSYTNDQSQTVTLYLVARLFEGDPRTLFLLAHGAGSMEHTSEEGSVYGHASANGAIAVGAIYAGDIGHDEVEPFSSRGPTWIRYPSPETRLKPDVCGIDGVTVSGAGGFDSPFYGTSAAAPHVAAVAAQLLSRHPTWTPDSVRAALTSTARDLGIAGPDYTFGYGLVNAYAAAGIGTAAGGVTAGGTWTRDNSPYYVTSDIAIQHGTTLRIEEGVEVRFESAVAVNVAGELDVAGTEDEPVRFTAGSGDSWGGFAVIDQGTAELRHARIEDVYTSQSNRGGALTVAGSGASALLVGCVVDGSSASNGSGVLASGGAQVSAISSQFTENTSAGASCIASLSGGSVQLTNCTIADNTGSALGTMIGTLQGEGCIIWGNSEGSGAGDSGVTVVYSDVQEGASGEGNIQAEPVFSVTSDGLYRLGAGSPCIDAARPTLEDADGTRADMGAWPTVQIFPWTAALQDRVVPVSSSTAVAITGTVQMVQNVSLAFTGLQGAVSSVAVQGPSKDGVTASAAISGDTVFVSLSSPEEFSLVDKTLAVLTLTVPYDAVGGQRTMAWLPMPYTNAGGQPLSTADATLNVIVPGDATGDGSLTSADAAMVLAVAAGASVQGDSATMDVSGDGSLSPYDAALIDYALSDPGHVFPAHGGTSPFAGDLGERVIYLKREDDTWVLCLSNAQGVVSGLVQIDAAFEPTVQSDGDVASEYTAGRLTIAFTRDAASTAPLAVLSGLTTAPTIVGGQLNEGAASVVLAPAAVTLHQNAPNPFNSGTGVSYDVPVPGRTRIAVYAVTGQLVTTLVDQANTPPGYHSVAWDGRDSRGETVASGVYVCRLRFDGEGGVDQARTMLMAVVR